MSDLTIEILTQIRDEVKQTNVRLEAVRDELTETRAQLSVRIDGTNERVDRLDKRQTEMEIRLATELVAVAGAVRELRDALLEDRKLRETVSDLVHRVTAIERRGAAH